MYSKIIECFLIPNYKIGIEALYTLPSNYHNSNLFDSNKLNIYNKYINEINSLEKSFINKINSIISTTKEYIKDGASKDILKYIVISMKKISQLPEFTKIINNLNNIWEIDIQQNIKDSDFKIDTEMKIASTNFVNIKQRIDYHYYLTDIYSDQDKWFIIKPLYMKILKVLFKELPYTVKCETKIAYIEVLSSKATESALIPVTESVDTSSGSFMNILKNEIITELKKANTKFIYSPPYKFDIYMNRQLNSYVLEFKFTYLSKSQMEYWGVKSNGDIHLKFPKILKTLLAKYPTLKYKKNTSTMCSFIMYTIYSENSTSIKEDNSFNPEFTPENIKSCANKIMKDLKTSVNNVKRKYPKFEWTNNPEYSFDEASDRSESAINICVVNLAKDYDIPGTSKVINEIIKEVKLMISKYYSNKSKVKIRYESEDDAITITLSYKS